MTSATLPNHKTHSVTWRLKDSNGNVVPDGNYKLVIELTEFSGTGKSQEYDFTKGPGPTMVMPPDTQYYTGVQISVQ
jgi:flagellar hook assembly protein FlgD